MALFDFLKKGKKEAKEEFEDIIPPPPKPKIEEIPSFPFEKEELLPPIKPLKPEITPLEEEEVSLERPAGEKGFEEEGALIPKPPKVEKPRPRLIREREEVVIEEPLIQKEIRPEPVYVKPVRPIFAPPRPRVEEGAKEAPYIRAYKFREIAQDLNKIAKDLIKVPTKLKSKKLEDAYEEFERCLDVVMKRLDSVERGVFE